jgi:alkanesulfonate monooxygenase SsuD/methylene tetrahydromethanopterin reductase-like flavin-dependent oxidoreductase (luciferase family)
VSTARARNSGLVGGNAFKLGLFGANCSGGLAFTKLPERWDASWDNNLQLAQLAEQSGLECLVPVARWKGFGGATNVNATSLETLAWAGCLLACTEKITVFGTVHVPMLHPIVAAKQMATIDQVGHGRFGANIVCGWNGDEFEMFGMTPDAHDLRYLRAEEWWEVVKLLWSGKGPSDYVRRFFNFRGLEGSPRPYGERDPLMMNAGASPAGRAFAIRHSDLHFDYCRKPEDSAERVSETKTLARRDGREIQVWIPASIVCRPTRRDAEDYAQHCVDNADWEALEHQYRLYAGNAGSLSRSAEENQRNRQENPARTILGYGGSYSLRGDPDDIAEECLRLHRAGFDGIAVGFVNYLGELPFFVQEVIPRLERAGLRLASGKI